jgi:hypothetical protein
VEKRFESGQLKSLCRSRAIRNLLTFLPIALLSVSLVSVVVVDAGPIPFQSSPQPPPAQPAEQPPPAPPPADTPPPAEQPPPLPPPPTDTPPPAQPAEQPAPTSPVSPEATTAPPQPIEEPTAEAAQEEEGDLTATESARRERGPEEPNDSSSGSAIDWTLFVETVLETVGYFWLCCGGLALVAFPIVLAAAYFVGRKRLLDSPSGEEKS